MYDFKPKTQEQELNDDIKEFESFIRTCEAGLLLAQDDDTAMAVEIAMGHSQSFKLWIDKNEHIRNLIRLEKQNAESQLLEAKTKLETLLRGGGN